MPRLPAHNHNCDAVRHLTERSQVNAARARSGASASSKLRCNSRAAALRTVLDDLLALPFRVINDDQIANIYGIGVSSLRTHVNPISNRSDKLLP